jgi:GAF domain-containing protein
MGFASTSGLQAIAAAPLRVRDRILGVMICGFRDANTFNDEQQFRIRKHISDFAISLDHALERFSVTTLLEGLYKASLLFTTEVSFEAALQNVLEFAVSVTGAKYGALGIKGPTRQIKPFLHSGVDDDLAKRLPLPKGIGILGDLLKEGDVINVSDVKDHPKFTGYGDPDHPVITSFLGAPIVVNNKPTGNIYVGNKKSGKHFSAWDRQMLVFLANMASASYNQLRERQHAVTSEGVTIAAVLLSQLGSAAKEKGAALSNALRAFVGRIPSTDREDFDRILEELRTLDTSIRTLEKGLEKRLDESVPMNYLLNEIVRLQRQKYDINIQADIYPACSIKGNEVLLEIAFGILVENAARAAKSNSSAPPSITITCKLEEGLLLGSIQDSGKGIPKEIQAQIYKRRLNRKGKIRDSSFIVGQVMRLHQGDVDIRESGPGGTTIDFWLPQSQN